MPPTPELQPLSQNKRRIFFFTLVLVFIIMVPLMVFYAVGYRFDIDGDLTNIRSVGGMYVSSGINEIQIYIDDSLVEDMRMFRSAAYIQNLEEGMHTLHVQGDGVSTWTKELPVFAHLVTEAESFNMPLVPQVRVVPQWSDTTGTGILFESATSTQFRFASILGTYRVATNTATSTYTENIEYLYIKNLFASSTQLQKALQNQKQPRENFSFGPQPVIESTSTATSTKVYTDVALYESGDEIRIRWIGNDQDMPYYYCVQYSGMAKTALWYGEHVLQSLVDQLGDTTDLINSDVRNQRLCRTAIRMDRLNQEVHWFDMYPDSTDLVLMHLDDGLYVVEADDRAWQNTQLLYPGEDIHVVLDGGRIYVQDGDYYLEVFTEIAS